MAHQEHERPNPHGDPLRDEIEENPAQRQSDAPGPDPTDVVGDATTTSDRARGRGSSANGIPAFDKDSGRERRRQYKDNDADLVSR